MKIFGQKYPEIKCLDVVHNDRLKFRLHQSYLELLKGDLWATRYDQDVWNLLSLLEKTSKKLELEKNKSKVLKSRKK